MVLVLVDAPPQAGATFSTTFLVGEHDPGMMPGGQGVESQAKGAFEEEAELDRPVALDARVGGTARSMVRDVRVDHGVLEGVGEVEDVVIEAELAGDAPGVLDVGHRAAPAVGRAAPELEGGTDDLVPGLGEEGGGDRRVDSARHGNEYADRQARNRSTTLGITLST